MKPSGDALSKHDYIVRECSLSEARSLVERYHYAKGGSNTRVHCHGLYSVSDPETCLGVAWWLPPTKVAAQSVSSDWRRVLSLTRLVVHPSLPTNAASFLLGRSIRLIRHEGKWTTLLTYADSGQGHSGGIYRATNWTFVTTTNGDNVYIDPSSGRHVSKKIGPKTRSHKQMLDLGYSCIGKTRKHKFVLHLVTGRTG